MKVSVQHKNEKINIVNIEIGNEDSGSDNVIIWLNFPVFIY
jgi:hypothetical protein